MTAIAKKIDVYRGSDWMTTRFSVAELLDTVERMQDVCLLLPFDAMGAQAYPAETVVTYSQYATENLLMISEFCDDLAAEMDMAVADLQPYALAAPAFHWTAFEMQQHLRAMRDLAHVTDDESVHATERLHGVLDHLNLIKDLIRQMDV
jgi:hypothetical protein